MAHPYWPLFDLRVRTPRLELRWVTDEDGVELAALAARGVHEPGTMPFIRPWTLRPSPELEREAFRHWWGERAGWTPVAWRLSLAVRCDGELVGVQAVAGEDFPVTRVVGTGSWLGRAHHGRGIGKEMRAAVLHLAFAGLGATEATSGAFEDNPASLAVSRALGYEDNGVTVRERLGEPARELRVRLTRERWEAHRTVEVTLEGLEACLPLFGLGPDLAPLAGGAGGDQGP